MDAFGYIIVYFVATLYFAWAGVVLLDDYKESTRRWGARVILTCWAWPIWLIIGVLVGVVQLVKALRRSAGGTLRNLMEEAGWLRRS